MKAILQRVLSASVTVDQEVVSSIGKGTLVFAAIAPGDTEKEAESMASKILKLKLWDDESGNKWKHSVRDIGGEVLCVSQFTLLASTKKGNKPDFHGALGSEEAKSLYDTFYRKVQERYQPDRVKDGVFQAMMQVALVNDGPVTIEIVTGQKPPKPETPAPAATGQKLPKPEKPSPDATGKKPPKPEKPSPAVTGQKPPKPKKPAPAATGQKSPTPEKPAPAAKP